MKIDITVIKNETVNKFEKSLKSVRNKFDDMLSIALDATVLEIDQEKRIQVEQTVGDILNDEFNKFVMSFTKTMNKASDLVQNELA